MPAQDRTLRAHLRTCVSCREAFDLQVQIRQVLASRGLDPAPLGFATRFRERRALQAPWVDMANWRWWSWRLLPVAACLVAFALGQRLASETVPQLELRTVLQDWASPERPTLVGVDRLLAVTDEDRNDLLVEVLTGERQQIEDATNER
jgi:predicted anti-sigma-YlaC factor YlaD